MCTAWKFFNAVSVLILNSTFFIGALAEESTGQKAHFQVEDKSGDLNIQATKNLAKVTAQADSVEVVVKPGTAQFPVLKSDKPIVHVLPPSLCGFKGIVIKKSLIGFQRQHDLPSRNKIKKAPHFMGIKTKLASFINRHMHPNQKTLSRHERHNNKSIKWPAFYNNRKSPAKIIKVQRKGKVFHRRRGKSKIDSSPSRKSVIKENETGFKVSGNAGKIKMKVTANETELESNSGTVDIMLKQPAKSQSNSAASDRSLQVKQQIHVAPELEEWDNAVGLKKSKVDFHQTLNPKMST